MSDSHRSQPFSLRAYRSLLATHLRRSISSEHYSSTFGLTSRKIPPLVLSLLQNFIISTIASVYLVHRTDPWSFAILMIGFSAVQLGFSILVEFQDVVWSPEENARLGHLPIAPKTIAAVRLTSLAVYLLLMSISLLAAPACISRSYHYIPTSEIPFLLAGITANLAATAAAILLFGVLFTVGGAGRLKRLLVLAQLGVMAIALFGSQYVFQENKQISMVFTVPPAWLKWSPIGWFAAISQLDLRAHDASVYIPAFLGLGSLIPLCIAAFFMLTSMYRSTLQLSAQQLSEWKTNKIREEVFDGIGKALTRNRQEAAIIGFSLRMIRRDPEFIARITPAIGIGPALALLGATEGKSSDVFVTQDFFKAAPSVIALYCLLVAVPLAATHFQISRSHQAAWLWSTAPIDLVPIRNGIRKTIMFGLVAPCCMILTLIFSIAWGNLLHAVLHVILGALGISICSRWMIPRLIRNWPFSRPYEIGFTTSRTASFLALALVLGLALGSMHIVAALDIARTMRLIVVLFVIDRVVAYLHQRVIR